MEIYLPEELKPFEADLHFFFDLMVRKLHVNRHKGFVEGKEILDLREGLRLEYAELTDAIDEGVSQFNIALECADVSNMAFLLALCCLRLTKREFKGDAKELRPAQGASLKEIVNRTQVGSNTDVEDTKRR